MNDEKPRIPQLAVPIRRLMEGFIDRHPDLQISEEVRASLDRIARSGIPRTYGDNEQFTYGELEQRFDRVLENADPLPPEQRADVIDMLVSLGEKVSALTAEVGELRKELAASETARRNAEKRTGKLETKNRRLAKWSIGLGVIGVLGVIWAVVTHFI